MFGKTTPKHPEILSKVSVHFTLRLNGMIYLATSLVYQVNWFIIFFSFENTEAKMYRYDQRVGLNSLIFHLTCQSNFIFSL